MKNLTHFGVILTLLLGTLAYGSTLPKLGSKKKPTQRLIIPNYQMEAIFDQNDMMEIVPISYVQAEKDSQKVVNHIADNGIKFILKKSELQYSPIVRTADKISQKLQTDIVVAGKTENSVEHKFSFKLEAFQALAKIEYTGWIKAFMTYNAAEAQTDFTLNELIFEDKEMFLKITGNQKESTSSLGVGWSW